LVFVLSYLLSINSSSPCWTLHVVLKQRWTLDEGSWLVVGSVKVHLMKRVGWLLVQF
jgi:hypothetical protein